MSIAAVQPYFCGPPYAQLSYHRALYRIPTCRRLKGHARQKGKKDLRERVYNKIVKLGVRSTDGMSMAGLNAGIYGGVWGN